MSLLPPPVWDDVPRTPEAHFRIHFLAAVYWFLRYLHRAGSAGPLSLETALSRFPFLDGYLREVTRLLPASATWDEGIGLWEAGVASWERGFARRPPLAAIGAALQVDFQARLALLLAGLVEEDARFGPVFGKCEAASPTGHATVALMGAVLRAEGNTDGCEDLRRRLNPWLEAGLLAPVQADLPRAAWALRPELALWPLLRGDRSPALSAWCRITRLQELPDFEYLALPTEFVRQLRDVPSLIQRGQVATLVMRGPAGGDQLGAVAAVARACGLGLATVGWPALQPAPGRIPLWGAAAALCEAVPVCEASLAPGELIDLPTADGLNPWRAICLESEGSLRLTSEARVLCLDLPELGQTERRRIWQNSLPASANGDFNDLADRFVLPGAYLRDVALRTAALAALDGRSKVQVEDVRGACRQLNHQHLDSLANPLPTEGDPDRLVVPPSTAARLQELEQRCRQRERLSGRLGEGFGRRPDRGIKALFTGPSGTGKTLAAQVLGCRLGLDVYRVDLAAVVNKYVGETEKNLHRILTRAEGLDVILLFDEGDSMFGKRSEVRSANDRYANLETNYLLQKIESFRGIVIVTTNAPQGIDRAFERRMDVVAHFPPPQASERLEIWRWHLPADHRLSEAALVSLAARCVLNGGQIRNAVQYSALLALEAGMPNLTLEQVQDALRAEYRKAGAICPPLQTETATPRDGRFARFLQNL